MKISSLNITKIMAVNLLVSFACCLSVTSCSKKLGSAESPEVTIDINIHHSYGLDAEGLYKLLILLADQGHCQININGVYIALPPVGTGPCSSNGRYLFRSYQEKLDSKIILKTKNPEISSGTDRNGLCNRELIKSWVDGNNVRAVVVSPGKDVEVNALLEVLNILNERVDYCGLAKIKRDDHEILLTELEVVETEIEAGNNTLKKQTSSEEQP